MEPPLTNTYLEVIRYDSIVNTIVFAYRLPINAGKSAVISSLAAVSEDVLIVAGSTNDYENQFFGLSPDHEENDEDWDGYVMFLDAINGQFLDAVRIASQPGRNDIVQSLCFFGNYLYVVGQTEGNISDTHKFDGGSFVLKMDWMKREIQSRKTISGMMSAPKCVASSDGVYVGFHVTQLGNHGSAMMEGAVISQDVIISKFPDDLSDNTGGGWSQWIDTTDSSSNIIREDYVVGMEYLKESNSVAVLLNSANFDQGLNDIYVLGLDKDTGANELKSPNSAGYSNQQPSQDPTDQSPSQSNINNNSLII